MNDDLRYVYAVCRPLAAPLHADLIGVGGAPPRQLVHEGLVAVVSPVPERDFGREPLRAHLEDLHWLAATARAHQNVVAALATVTCPLPLRLATVFHDDSGVRAMLEDESERLHRILDRIDGHVEWGVKVWLGASAGDGDEGADGGRGADGSAASSPARVPRSGRDYLRCRRAGNAAREEALARAEVFTRRLHGDLARYAADARLHPVQSGPLTDAGSGRNILNSAYLVPRTWSEEFLELIGRTEGTRPGLRVEVTGPWAAYSFTDDPDAGEGPHGGEGAARQDAGGAP
ncbi:GvpL/GvpF family gas vesicle protein [Streptomyces sp. NPDC127108]|uniref:GvpL/GvpF family gas vesicle protein n=1 Tax=Streptomyces sp. NPDC127108 TaxID=3345361 RepID=UPI00363E3972